jgi:hypothetical protein
MLTAPNLRQGPWRAMFPPNEPPKDDCLPADPSGLAVSLTVQQKGLFSCFIQLVTTPFRADFDLSGSPPVYKTAALPLSYAGVP